MGRRGSTRPARATTPATGRDLLLPSGDAESARSAKTTPGDEGSRHHTGRRGPVEELGSEVVVEQGGRRGGIHRRFVRAFADAALASRDGSSPGPIWSAVGRSAPTRIEAGGPARLRAGQGRSSDSAIPLGSPMPRPNSPRRARPSSPSSHCLGSRVPSRWTCCSSQATVAGYKARLLAAMNLPRSCRCS